MKVLTISVCNDCPYFKVSGIHGIDDSYRATCNNPDIDSFDWSVKRGCDAEIPPKCPLNDTSDYNY